MAKKPKVNKSQAVRDYLKTHPKATSGEIAAALNKKGITITANYAANIKSQSKKKRRATKAPKLQVGEAVTAFSTIHQLNRSLWQLRKHRNSLCILSKYSVGNAHAVTIQAPTPS